MSLVYVLRNTRWSDVPSYYGGNRVLVTIIVTQEVDSNLHTINKQFGNHTPYKVCETVRNTYLGEKG